MAVRKYSMFTQSVDPEFVPEGHRGHPSCFWQSVSWASRSVSHACPPPDLEASVLDAERDRPTSCPLGGWKPTSVSAGRRALLGALGDHQRGVSGPSECSRDAASFRSPPVPRLLSHSRLHFHALRRQSPVLPFALCEPCVGPSPFDLGFLSFSDKLLRRSFRFSLGGVRVGERYLLITLWGEKVKTR